MEDIEYKTKIKLLIDYANAYYIYNNPIATDEEYDLLYREILEFEKLNPTLIDGNSPTQRVGGVITDKFKKAKHLSRMWSQEDIFNIKELENWIIKVSKVVENITFICEPKFDGVSLNLIYKDGILNQAISRGDGTIGEDVTLNAKTMHSIPLTIPYKDIIEIRGEVVIRKDDFEIVNRERIAENKESFANPRNAASGSLRQRNSSVTAKRKLYFQVWGVGKNNLDFKKSSEVMNFIFSLGFEKPTMITECTTIDDIEKSYHNFIKKRDSMPMGLDGMIIKIDLLESQLELGYTVKFPKWSCAYKFPAVEKVTTVKNIILQIGRTGAVTPVAILEPIFIDGSTVEKTTLYNFDEIKRLKLKIGDKVIIIKSGDIIPKITKVLKDRRDGTEKPIIKPTLCPTCNKELLDENILIKCQNIECPSRIISSIVYFASKNCLNIEGLGSKLVELLVNKGRIKDILTLYTLEYKDLESLEGFQDKRINNLLNAIENTKHIELYKLINALGIEHIGEVASKQISLEFGKDILNVTFQELITLDGVGDKGANSFITFIKVNKELITKLFNLIEPTIEIKKEILENRFKDKRILLPILIVPVKTILLSLTPFNLVC